MDAKNSSVREIAVPVSVFGSLRRELEKEAGTLPTVHALHHAGYRAGAEAADAFSRSSGGDVFSSPRESFWSRLGDFFGKRGWGNLNHEEAHAGVGLLSSADWAEASVDEIDPDASCCFSTGFLSGLLSQLAGGPVAVLEVECRTRGEAACRFAFGSEGAIHDLYGHLIEGGDLYRALASL